MSEDSRVRCLPPNSQLLAYQQASYPSENSAVSHCIRTPDTVAFVLEAANDPSELWLYHKHSETRPATCEEVSRVLNGSRDASHVQSNERLCHVLRRNAEAEAQSSAAWRTSSAATPPRACWPPLIRPAVAAASPLSACSTPLSANSYLVRNCVLPPPNVEQGLVQPRSRGRRNPRHAVLRRRLRVQVPRADADAAVVRIHWMVSSGIFYCLSSCLRGVCLTPSLCAQSRSWIHPELARDNLPHPRLPHELRMCVQVQLESSYASLAS